MTSITMPLHRRAIVALLAGLLLAGPGAAPAGAVGRQAPSHLPELVASVRIQPPLDFCAEPVPLKSPEVRERLEKELLLVLWNRAQVLLWLKRAARYMPVIEPALQQAGLPADLKYVPVVESALRPHAGSSKGAVGFWQFIASTGRRQGLTVNRLVDQRRHIVFSTRAAIRYLKALHDEFGSWSLAAAAYNMGERGLAGQIEIQEHNDYYRLYLPQETQRYLFRLLAVKLVLENPQRFGFHLETGDRYPPVRSKAVELRCRQTTPLMIAARAAHTDFKAIKDLNPHLRGYELATGRHTVFVPPAAAASFAKRFGRMARDWTQRASGRTYQVRRGDTLSAIAARFNLPLTSLLRWNRLSAADPIHPGDRLRLHP